MSDIIVSKYKNGEGYKATQGGKKIAEGETQNEAGWNGHKKDPHAAVVAQRVKTTEFGYPDEFRRMYPTDPRKK